jgi:hypothetical protein
LESKKSKVRREKLEKENRVLKNEIVLLKAALQEQMKARKNECSK